VKQQETVLGEEKAMENIEGLIDEADMEMFKAAHEKREKLQKCGSGSKAGASGSSSTPSSSKPVVPAFSPIPGVKAMTPQWAKKFIPTCHGCRINLDDRRFHRWNVTYEGKPGPPYSFSKVYNDESVITSRMALLMCLKWVWSVHTSLTGEQCPFVLDG
jgi:hypothetical protein